jgi:hypothetical protein
MVELSDIEMKEVVTTTTTTISKDDKKDADTLTLDGLNFIFCFLNLSVFFFSFIE